MTGLETRRQGHEGARPGAPPRPLGQELEGTEPGIWGQKVQKDSTGVQPAKAMGGPGSSSDS